MKHYRITIEPLIVEAEDEEDARQQALSMIEEGAWDLEIEDAEEPGVKL